MTDEAAACTENSLNSLMPSLRSEIRRQGIAARDAIEPQERERLSAIVCERIAFSEEFKSANTVLIYKHTRGELSLYALTEHPLAEGKRFAYPLCISGTEMLALIPSGDNAWKTGCFGIKEPIPECSEAVAPEELDLIICPCSAFDAECHRMGMGAGYYDRYLPKCKNARIIAAAFDAQRQAAVPCDSWDYIMDSIYTDAGKY